MNIGAALRDEREKRGWSQREMAKKLGMVRTYLSKVERNRLVPTIRVLVDLAAVMGMPLSEFVKVAEGFEPDGGEG